MDTFVSVDHAIATVLASARLQPPERVPLADAVGRTLAESVVAEGPLPPFDTSSMDGYAVRVGDLADRDTLPLAGSIHAGDGALTTLPLGACLAMMTGAPLPAGTEAIVPVEWTTRTDNSVCFDRVPEPGQFVRQRGGALAEGAEVLAAGAVVTPRSVGLMAAVGAASVIARTRPVVAIVTTGDELVGADRQPGPGQIRDANGPALAAQVVACGGTPLSLHATDAPGSLSDALDLAAQADVLVFAGGVSMGTRDLVRPELEQRGVEWLFWKVRQRPGKPFAFGTVAGTPVLGLPGNPVSAVVGFEVYARPLLAACLGRRPDPEPEMGRLAAAVDKADGLTTFARVTAQRDADGGLVLTSAGAQDSHIARSLLLSDGLAWIPADWAEAPAGSRVAFRPWGG